MTSLPPIFEPADDQDAPLDLQGQQSAPAPIDVQPEQLERFFRAGGVLRLSEFLRWDDETQEAAAQIAETVAAQRIYALAAAIRDEGSLQAVQRRFDAPGADRSLVDAALDLAAAGIEAQTVQTRPARPLGRSRS